MLSLKKNKKNEGHDTSVILFVGGDILVIWRGKISISDRGVYNNHTTPLHKGWAPYTVGPTPCEGVLYDCCTLGVQLSLFYLISGWSSFSRCKWSLSPTVPQRRGQRCSSLEVTSTAPCPSICLRHSGPYKIYIYTNGDMQFLLTWNFFVFF
jgi:hypothetical protein